jgi:rhamnulokinase
LLNLLNLLGYLQQTSGLTDCQQLTSDTCGVKVQSGPVEATLYGNIAIQAIAAGVLPDLAAARRAISKSFSGETFLPARR